MLETFLSGDDFTDVLTEVGYQLDFAEQDKLLADQIVDDQKVLDVLHANVVSAREQTAELAEARRAGAQGPRPPARGPRARRRSCASSSSAETQTLLEEQKAAYEQMAHDKAALEQKLAESREAERKLEELINKLVQQMLEDGGIPSEYNGKFDWPMPGTVTQEFGCTGFHMEPPLGNCDHFHRGIDIANAPYTPIRAAGTGQGHPRRPQPVRPGLDRDHRPLVQPGDLVRPRRRRTSRSTWASTSARARSSPTRA